MRVTERDGRWAGERRSLTRDTQAPEAAELIPANGTEGVDPNTLLLGLFSEPIRHQSLGSADGFTLTRLSTGDPVAGQIVVAGTAVALVPGAALAPGESYTLRAGTGITDLAGHPLATPLEATFVTAQELSGAPVLDPLPAVLCESSLQVKGAAAPHATVRVRDGELSFTGTADAAGRFAITIPLSGEGFHLLHVAAVDRSGAQGAETTAELRLDCSGPTVTAATFDRETGVLEVTFSEEIDPATATIGIPGAALHLTLEDDPAAGEQDAAITVSGATLDLLLDTAPDAWWQRPGGAPRNRRPACRPRRPGHGRAVLRPLPAHGRGGRGERLPGRRGVRRR